MLRGGGGKGGCTIKRRSSVPLLHFVSRAPVSLGQAVLSGEDMYMSAMKGKGVHPIHILGDHLW